MHQYSEEFGNLYNEKQMDRKQRKISIITFVLKNKNTFFFFYFIKQT